MLVFILSSWICLHIAKLCVNNTTVAAWLLAQDDREGSHLVWAHDEALSRCHSPHPPPPLPSCGCSPSCCPGTWVRCSGDSCCCCCCCYNAPVPSLRSLHQHTAAWKMCLLTQLAQQTSVLCGHKFEWEERQQSTVPRDPGHNHRSSKRNVAVDTIPLCTFTDRLAAAEEWFLKVLCFSSAVEHSSRLWNHWRSNLSVNNWVSFSVFILSVLDHAWSLDKAWLIDSN